MPFTRPEPLRGKHDFGDFACGDESLDLWLHRHARQAEAGRSARVFITTDGKAVVGYYALAAGQIDAAVATARATKGQPAGRPVPAVILTRLALDGRQPGGGGGRSAL